MSWNKDLKLKQVDELINELKPLVNHKRPRTGWLKLIRTTLAMSARALGERVGLAQSRIALIERGEVDGTITLNTLEKVADGLECDVVYYLIPREQSLAKMRENQAYKKAKALNDYAELQMNLENQATSKKYQEQEIEKTKNEYLRTWPVDFWDKL